MRESVCVRERESRESCLREWRGGHDEIPGGGKGTVIQLRVSGYVYVYVGVHIPVLCVCCMHRRVEREREKER